MKIDLSINREILAVVTLDHSGLMVAKSAAALALKSRRRLRLVTVCDQSHMSVKAESETADRLHKLGLFVDYGIDIRSSIIDSRYPSSLLELATAHQSILMVVGQKAGSKDTFNHTIELMAGAVMPVLVIPESSQKILSDAWGYLNILIADDLTDSSAKGIECLTDFLDALRLPVNVLHIHVEPVDVKTMILSPDYELKLWPQFEVRERHLDIRYEKIKRTLRARSANLIEAIDLCAGIYHSELWHGSVFEELNRAALSHRSDIVVLGRHHTFHKHPISVGQMRYEKMLDLNRPIMMTPEFN